MVETFTIAEAFYNEKVDRNKKFVRHSDFAELEAENEWLKLSCSAWEDIARINKARADDAEALSRTGEVKVKALEWEDADEGMCTKWRAAALGGHYELVALDGDDGGLAVNFHWGKPLSFWFIQGEADEFGPTGPKIFLTIEAAKAAAQADYERRIRAAITIEPAAPEGQQEPVAWLAEGYGYQRVFIEREAAEKMARGGSLTPLYTRPKTWQPIETAPQDGSRVLCWSAQWESPESGCRYGMFWASNSLAADKGGWKYQPSHWMQLPQPPALKAAMEAGR